MNLQQLGRYRVLCPLGQGGFGQAYLAEDLSMDRRCVVKASMRHSAAHRVQFEREAQILAALDHPNLPEVYDYFVEDGQPYLVMEYIEGHDLQSLAQKQAEPFELDQVLRWADDLLDALTYLHGQDPPIIHRDVKPSNVCVMPDGKAVLLDFGIARQLDDTGTFTGALGRSSFYSPIEQQYSPQRIASLPTIRRQQDQLKRVDLHTGTYSDVYSLAATLYFALTLLDPREAALRLLRERLVPIRKLNANVPRFMVKALNRALAVDPRRRCRTATELRKLLKLDEKPPGSLRSSPRVWLIAVGLLLVITLVGVFLRGWLGDRTAGVLSPVSPSLLPSSTPIPVQVVTLEPSSTPLATPSATPSPTPTPIPHLIVADDQLKVYGGPGEMYDVLGQVNKGDRVAILGRSGDGRWWQVSYLGWRGWVPAKSVVADVDPLAIPTAEIPIPPVNRTPEAHISVASTVIEAWGAMSVTCEAVDPDSDELAYTWEASDGFITGEGDAVTYNAPKVTGGQTITVAVRDEHGLEAKRSIQVHVVLAQPPPGTFEPFGIFGQIWREYLEPHRRLGWANEEERVTDGAHQFFERGVMFWRKDTDEIYVIIAGGNWQVYTDTWEEGMKECSCPDVAPPQGKYIPIRGFGKVWCEQLGASNAKIGWATTPEQAYEAHWQAFEHGFMCQGLDEAIYVLYEDGSWQPYSSAAGGVSLNRSNVPPQQFHVGERVRVCTAYDRLAVRTRPRLGSSELTLLEPGTSLTVVDGPAYADGWPWWRVWTSDGIVGWVAEGGDEVDPYFICPER
jgi:serine/threonine protein kinase